MSQSTRQTLISKTNKFTPFQYPKAIEFYERQTRCRWEPNEVKFTTDLLQWPTIDPTIKAVVAGVLRGFVQTEVVVGDYWTTNITNWFPNPEVSRMAIRFADMEGVHALSYNQLSDTLGIDSYKAFMADPSACKKLDYLLSTPTDSLQERARALAVFSAFTEGVVLFSSFAILQWLKTQNLLPGVSKVIDYSILDEQTHSEAGCWLFRTLLSEHPELNTRKLWEQIETAAKTVVKLEHSFIDSVFQSQSLPDFDPEDLKQFIIARTNSKLAELGSTFKLPCDEEASDRIAIRFEVQINAQKDTDFFVKAPSNYTLGIFHLDTDELEF